MTDDSQFTALVLEEDDDHNVTSSVQTLNNDRLPEGDVTVGVEYSTLNYKDGLAVSGKGRICRSLPLICGIDLAGTVLESRDDAWEAFAICLNET